MERFFRYKVTLPQARVFTSDLQPDHAAGSFTRNLKVHTDFSGSPFNSEGSIQIGKVRNSDFANWIPELAESLGLSRSEKGKIWLIIRIHTGHKLDVRAVRIGKASVPCIAKLVVAPGPLLFAR